ncbi:MAG: flagellar export protein FliJ [Gammaproteobacteria bacterium]
MSKAKRMQPVARIAQQHSDAAARVLEDNRQQLAMKQQQLDELIVYRDEYAQGLRHKSRNGLNATQIRDYNQFLNRLNLAIEQQQLAMETACREIESSKQDWVGKQRRARVMDNVVDRHRQQEQRDHAQQEQLENDEHALRTPRRENG